MIIFDIETTGTNVYEAEIITGYFLACDPVTFAIRGEFELKCNPFKWSYEAQEIHGITKEQASKWPLFREVYDKLLSWLQSHQAAEIWMHTNAKMYGKLTYFDYAVLRLRMMDMGDQPYFEIERLKPYSTHSLAKVLQPQFAFDGFSLNNICKSLNIDLNHHDAKSDALACHQIIKKLLPMTSREELQNYDKGVEDENSIRVSQRSGKKPRRIQSSIGFVPNY
jgi:DNA polymerase III epsilon subunit-like protein